MTSTHTPQVKNFVFPHPGSRVKDSFLWGAWGPGTPNATRWGPRADMVRFAAQCGLEEKLGERIWVGMLEKGQRTKGKACSRPRVDKTQPWAQGAVDGNGKRGGLGVVVLSSGLQW